MTAPGDGLTAGELSLVRAAVAEAVVRRRQRRELVPAAMHELLARLDGLLLTSAVNGTAVERDSAKLELIGTAEAARILGCCQEWVRRISNKLGGERIGGRWVYPRDAVEEHRDGAC